MNKKVFLNNWFLFKLSFESLPWYMILIILISVMQSAVVFIEHVFAVQYVLNVVEHGYPVYRAFIMIIVTIILVSVKLFLSGLFEQKVTPKAVLQLNYKVRRQIYIKAKNIDVKYYDNPSFYNKFTFAISESDNCIERMLKSIQKLIEALTTVLLSVIFFISIDYISLFFVVSAFLLSTLINSKINKIDFAVKCEEIDFQKKRNYLNRVLYMNEYAKELRIFPNVKKYFMNEFKNANDDILDIEKQVTKKKWLLGFVKDYCCNDLIINTCFIIYLLFKTLIFHTLSFGNFIVLYNSSSDFKNTLIDISEILPKFTENSMYVQKIRDFLSYSTYNNEKHDTLEMPPKFMSLEFKNVSFSYNNQEKEVISDINFKIDRHDKIALVGFNGAGKSTLIKLLLRLYEPTKGEILLNGINIKHLNLVEYWEKMGVVFQDFNIYASTLRDNIILGDSSVDDKQIYNSLSLVDFSYKLSNMKNGLNTQLTKEFYEDGVNLSGGESQKVAISRTLLDEKFILILDEPSSALDPVAESNINKIMFDASKECNVIFISHRLSTTRKSDYILFMKDGQIVESGTHDELLQQDKEYAKMWKIQSSQYLSVFKDYEYIKRLN